MIIKRTYQRLLHYRPIRRHLRAMRAQIQSICGYSDPFYDIVNIARQANAGIFLDIGCHHGETLLRFMESGLNCSAAAFDPNADNLERAKVILARYPRIRFYEMAMSDVKSRAPFYLNNNEQTSSLLSNAQGNLESFPDDTARRKVLEVQTERLDAWAAEHFSDGVAVVKCDTQGAEEKVIRGGIHFIREQVAAFYGEVMLGDMYEGQSSFQGIRNLLEGECGMLLRNIYPCLHDKAGRAVQLDALWVKPSFLISK